MRTGPKGLCECNLNTHIRGWPTFDWKAVLLKLLWLMLTNVDKWLNGVIDTLGHIGCLESTGVKICRYWLPQYGFVRIIYLLACNAFIEWIIVLLPWCLSVRLSVCPSLGDHTVIIQYKFHLCRHRDSNRGLLANCPTMLTTVLSNAPAIPVISGLLECVCVHIL